MERTFTNRRETFISTWMQHVRYAFNGHFIFAVIFAVSVVGANFDAVLEAIPSWVPVPLIVAGVIVYALKGVRWFTFVHPADFLFLFPRVSTYRVFVRRQWALTFVFHSFPVVLCTAVGLPFAQMTSDVLPFYFLVFLFYVSELLFSFVRLHVYAGEGRSFAVVRVIY
ncbi:MAG: ABC transporter permease, partial [Bacilli bacterium]